MSDHVALKSIRWSQNEGQAAAPVPPRIINTSQLSLRQQKRFIEEKKVCTTPKTACLLTRESSSLTSLYHACMAEELPHTDNTRANARQAIIYDNFCSRGKQIIASNRSSRPSDFSILVLIRKFELMQVRDQFLHHQAHCQCQGALSGSLALLVDICRVCKVMALSARTQKLEQAPQKQKALPARKWRKPKVEADERAAEEELKRQAARAVKAEQERRRKVRRALVDMLLRTVVRSQLGCVTGQV